MLKSVCVVSRKLVKPHIPTPHHLKSYKISFLDQLIPPINLGIVLFYPSKPKRISDLEDSLSKSLVPFYPLAGRYNKRRLALDCSDQGVEFIHAEVDDDVEFNDIISERDSHKLGQDLLPLPIRRLNEPAPIASIQVTELKRGGLALGISVSHKILDAHSVYTFLKAWGHALRETGTERSGLTVPVPVDPDFNFPSLFPCRDDVPEEDMEHDPDVIGKRFVFNKDAIAALRSKLTNCRNGPVSKARAVSAFISLALIRLDKARQGRVRDCIISQPVDMRGRTIPPLPLHCCGNLAFVSTTRSIPAAEAESLGIQELADLIGDATEKSVAEFAGIFFPDRDRYRVVNDPLADFVAKTQGGEVNVMWFTNWRKFGFYDVDLGWGKPGRVHVAPLEAEKMTVILRNKEGDGIDALVHLKRNDMDLIEQDEEMKLFAF